MTAGVALIALGITTVAQCQEFEAAAVRLGDKSSQNMHFSNDHASYIAENAPLKSIILDAFDTKDYLFAGPAWLADERYTIIARAHVGTTPGEKKLMAQHLLIERFRMKFHRETAERPVYALLVAKGGPRLEPFDGSGGSTPVPGPGEKFTVIGRVSALADVLSRRLGRPVLDRTGIDGRFNMRLSGFEWPSQPVSTGLPSVFSVIQEQLGLRLEPQRGQVETLVIDSVDRTPTEN